MEIVTAGKGWLDIDAYGAMIAYAELLRLLGREAVAVSSVEPNDSVTKSLRGFDEIRRDYVPAENDSFIVLDVSDPENFDPIIDTRRVTEVIDHHPGYEEYWKEKIGDGAEILSIGAVCTLIYEKWRDAGLLSEMRKSSATLLAAGILDNTLNFGAKITAERDKQAFSSLLKIGGLGEEFVAEYFSGVQKGIEADICRAVKDDLKIASLGGWGEKIRFGQIAVWDGERILPEFVKQDSKFDFMNFINVSGKHSFFIASDEKIKNFFEELLGIRFEGNVARAERLWLRKEIIRESLGKK